jgi:hypothetical protein
MQGGWIRIGSENRLSEEGLRLITFGDQRASPEELVTDPVEPLVLDPEPLVLDTEPLVLDTEPLVLDTEPLVLDTEPLDPPPACPQAPR